MDTAVETSEAKAIMGTKPRVACGEAGPPGIEGLKVSQSSAAPMVSNMPGFMPPLKATAFIIGGQPEAPLLLGVGGLVFGPPLPGGKVARPSRPGVTPSVLVWREVLPAGSWASFGCACPGWVCPDWVCPCWDRPVHLAETVRAKRPRWRRWYIMKGLQPKLT